MLKMINDGKVFEVPEVKDQKDISYAVLSDLHTGHVTGYLPPNMMSKSGNLIRQNQLQRKVHRETIRHLKEIGEVDILIILGDLCEGKQVKIAGVGLHDCDTDTMVKWAVHSVLEWCSILKPKVIIITKGTDYHTTVGIGGDLDYQIASILGATFSVYYGVELYLKLGELIWYLRHYYPTVSVNRMMPLEKMFRFKARDVAAGRCKVIPDVMGFGHVHVSMPLTKIENRTYAFVAPALKGKDDYMRGKGYPYEADLGLVHMVQTGKYVDQYRFYRILP